MSTIKAKDGTPIYYKDWGKGPVVTFSHGWPLNADMWDGQMLFLAQNGYRVIAHDRRGHGRSGQASSGNDIYIRRVSGGEFTAKDFRTWAGTVYAAARLAGEELPESVKAGEKIVVRVVREVAERLGNTPAVCRKSYIHPKVIEAFAAGRMPGERTVRRMLKDESRVLRLLGR
jgi:DNA topoisomerase IB